MTYNAETWTNNGKTEIFKFRKRKNFHELCKAHDFY